MVPFTSSRPGGGCYRRSALQPAKNRLAPICPAGSLSRFQDALRTCALGYIVAIPAICPSCVAWRVGQQPLSERRCWAFKRIDFGGHRGAATARRDSGMSDSLRAACGRSNCSRNSCRPPRVHRHVFPSLQRPHDRRTSIRCGSPAQESPLGARSRRLVCRTVVVRRGTVRGREVLRHRSSRPPALTSGISPRPSMPPGTTDYSWFIFERGYTGRPEFGWARRSKSAARNSVGVASGRLRTGE
jgi:hypothetical protein